MLGGVKTPDWERHTCSGESRHLIGRVETYLLGGEESGHVLGGSRDTCSGRGVGTRARESESGHVLGRVEGYLLGRVEQIIKYRFYNQFHLLADFFLVTWESVRDRVFPLDTLLS